MPEKILESARRQHGEEFLPLAAAHVKRRLAEPRRKPITVGYAIALLRSPEKFGFELRAEGWAMPAGEGNLAAGPPRLDAEAVMRERGERERENRRRLDEASVRLAWWRALPERVRRRVLDHVRRQDPLFCGARPDDHSLVESRCIEVAKAWSKAGKLEGGP